MPTPIKNLAGLVQGRLTVMHRLEEKKAGSYLHLCKCLCGTEVKYTTAELLHKYYPRKSCGYCKADTKYHKEYTTWESMRDRCSNPARTSYAHYGAKGITICDRWKEDFFYFLADMGLAPTKYHTLDRIDVTGNYTKENCRWLHISLQNDNTTRNLSHILTELRNGKELNIREAVEASCGTKSRHKNRSGYQPHSNSAAVIRELRKHTLHTSSNGDSSKR